MIDRVIPKASDRQSAVLWARGLLDSGDVLFLDTETTGLGPQAEIIDLAIVATTGRWCSTSWWNRAIDPD